MFQRCYGPRGAGGRVGYAADVSDEFYPGQTLGLPESGRGSLASWRARVAAILIDWAASMTLAVAQVVMVIRRVAHAFLSKILVFDRRRYPDGVYAHSFHPGREFGEVIGPAVGEVVVFVIPPKTL